MKSLLIMMTAVVSLFSVGHTYPANAITMTAAFNPGFFWTSFDYTFTVGAGEVPAGTTSVDIDLGGGPGPGGAVTRVFPINGGSVTTAGVGTSGTFTPNTAGPPPTPQILTLSRPAGLLVGSSITINSGHNPNAIPGVRPFIPFIGPAPAPARRTVLGALTIPGVAVPALAAVPTVGSTEIRGTGTPDSFVFIWQDNPSLPPLGPESLPTIELARGEIDPSGFFDLSLASPLTDEMLSVGVSLTNQFIPDAGEIAIQFSPVPEPSTLLLLGSVLAGLVGFASKRRFVTS